MLGLGAGSGLRTYRFGFLSFNALADVLLRWANSLFGQMILDLEERKPHLLKLSYQPGPVLGVGLADGEDTGPAPGDGGP